MRKFVAGAAAPARSGVSTLDLFAGEDAPRADILVGIDEVGRGPLAGPVVACAAVLKAPDIMPELNDSKKLTRKKREAMFDAVKEADFLAMRRALQALGLPGISEPAPEIPVESKGSFAEVAGKPAPRVFIAVDGNLKIRGIPENIQMPIVKGDGRIASISAASILAKVFRDRFMDKLAETYPAYGFEKNAGYGSKTHLDAIRKFGFTPVHRRSFHVKELEG